MSSKGRTELQISLSRAKIDEEVAGDVRFCVAPQKTGENVKKQFFWRKISVKIFFRRRKTKRRELSETRFDKVWRLYGPSLMGKLCENFTKFRENLRIACFGKVLAELEANGSQNQVPRQSLLWIDLS